MRNVSAALLSVLFFGNAASASTIAVIDSGVDLMHRDLVDHEWINKGETDKNRADDDRNGYVDDIRGWNFAENNNKVIDYKHLGTFSADCYKFFEIQTKVMEGTATAEERAWVKSKIEDQSFLRELMKFGNFVHGTHVSGIASREVAQTRIMALKIIPTEISPFSELIAEMQTTDRTNLTLDFLLKLALGKLASTQSKVFERVGKYVHDGRAHVANCSFGTGMAQAKQIVTILFKLFMGRNPSEQELHDNAAFFVNKMVEGASKMTASAPNTLFVMAAGNEGTNNDVDPISPANIRVDNSITVAATLRNLKLASFSNYGVKMVDVAAPGVGIESAIPGNEYLAMSGTSQAAPFVANVAAQVRDANPALKVSEVKKILLETVDIKDYLAGKVVTSGTVNAKRAEMAAQLSARMSVSEAIRNAREAVRDFETSRFFDFETAERDLFVLPLPSTIR